jgi:hypothetical protein
VEVTYERASLLQVEQQFCRLLFSWLRSWGHNRVFLQSWAIYIINDIFLFGRYGMFSLRKYIYSRSMFQVFRDIYNLWLLFTLLKSTEKNTSFCQLLPKHWQSTCFPFPIDSRAARQFHFYTPNITYFSQRIFYFISDHLLIGINSFLNNTY